MIVSRAFPCQFSWLGLVWFGFLHMLIVITIYIFDTFSLWHQRYDRCTVHSTQSTWRFHLFHYWITSSDHERRNRKGNFCGKTSVIAQQTNQTTKYVIAIRSLARGTFAQNFIAMWIYVEWANLICKWSVHVWILWITFRSLLISYVTMDVDRAMQDVFIFYTIDKSQFAYMFSPHLLGCNSLSSIADHKHARHFFWISIN